MTENTQPTEEESAALSGVETTIKRRITLDEKTMRKINIMLPVYETDDNGLALAKKAQLDLIVKKGINLLFEEFKKDINNM